MKVEVTEYCVGTGQCVVVASGIFALNEDGRSTVVAIPSTPDEIEATTTAADLCPMAAIRLER